MKIYWLSLVLGILFPLCGKGQEVLTNTSTTTTTVVTNSLPASLPIGSTNQFYNWIVTNQVFGRCVLSVTLNYTTTNGYSTWRQTPTWYKYYDSFSQFQDDMSSASVTFFQKLRGQMDSQANVYVTWILSYEDSLSLPWPFWINGLNVGPADSVTAESFKGLMPEPDHARANHQLAIVSVKDLRQFSVQVNSIPPYSYSWPDSTTAQTTNVYPEDGTGFWPDLIVLNDWYSFGQYKARFTVGANGLTGTYTQSGDLLRAPITEVISPSMVRMTMTRGSDTTLQESSDIMTWKTVRVVGWDESSTNAVIDVPVYPADHAFFRAWSE